MARKKGIDQLTLWKTQSRKDDAKPQSSRKELLAEADAQSRELFRYSAIEHANIMGGLFRQRRIPIFYFNQAAEEMGLPTQICRQWRVMEWPVARTRDTQKIDGILELYLKVFTRISSYPNGETFPEAMTRLAARIKELEGPRMTKNQISQHLRMSFRTLLDVLEKAQKVDTPTVRNTRQRHCPWELLERLDHIEEETQEQKEKQSQHKRVQREYSSQGPRIPPTPPEGAILTTRNGICGKCKSSWVHLYETEENTWGYMVMACRACGANNMLVEKEPEDNSDDPMLDPNAHHIERYAPCGNCSSPWHNLTRDDNLENGSTVYLCMICSEINIVPPRQKPQALQSTDIQRQHRPSRQANQSSPAGGERSC